VEIFSDRAAEIEQLEELRDDPELGRKLLGALIDIAKKTGASKQGVVAFTKRLPELLQTTGALGLLDLDDESMSTEYVETPERSAMSATALPTSEELAQAEPSFDPETFGYWSRDLPNWLVHPSCVNALSVPLDALRVITFDDSASSIVIDRILHRLKARKLRPASLREALQFDLKHRAKFSEQDLAIVVLGAMSPACEVTVLKWLTSRVAPPIRRVMALQIASRPSRVKGAPRFAFLVAPL
jgi:hypothetical protein